MFWLVHRTAKCVFIFSRDSQGDWDQEGFKYCFNWVTQRGPSCELGVSYLGETVLHNDRYYKSSSGAAVGGHTVLSTHDPITTQWSAVTKADELTFPGRTVAKILAQDE